MILLLIRSNRELGPKKINQHVWFHFKIKDSVDVVDSVQEKGLIRSFTFNRWTRTKTWVAFSFPILPYALWQPLQRKKGSDVVPPNPNLLLDDGFLLPTTQLDTTHLLTMLVFLFFLSFFIAWFLLKCSIFYVIFYFVVLLLFHLLLMCSCFARFVLNVILFAFFSSFFTVIVVILPFRLKLNDNLSFSIQIE